MRIIFFGTPLFVVPVLDTLADTFQLIGVVTAPDRKVGRKQLMTPSPVKTAFQNARANAKEPQDETILLTPELFSPESVDQLNNVKPDLFVTAAYGKILPKEILAIPRLGSINIHPSLLPTYRGPSPIQSAIRAGDSETGVSFLLMDEKIDHGPLLEVIKYPLHGTETFETLATDLFHLAADHIEQAIIDFANGKKPIPQDETKATYCKPITKQDGFVDPVKPPQKDLFDRMVRAYYPWPSVWTRWENKIIKFYPNDIVQLEGKNPVTKETFLRGYPQLPQAIKELL